MNQLPEAPTAKRVPHERTHHGDTVTDEYFWLQDKDDAATIQYLNDENGYTDAVTAHLAGLREELFTEIRSRTQETDLSLPLRRGDWWYYTRTVEGQQYSIHCRVPVQPGVTAPPSAGDGGALPDEQILLDGNVLAGDSDFFALGTFQVSADARRLAYSTDFDGNERYTLRVKDLDTGEVLADEIPNTFYGSAWSLDGSVLFYLTVDETWRPNKVWRHVVGTPATDDVLVYEETDQKFWVGVGLTRSQRYIMIDSHSKITSEIWAIPADQPASAPFVIAARRQGVEYDVEHWSAPTDPVAAGTSTGDSTPVRIGPDAGDRFLILHNDGGAEDFELAYAPVDEPASWTTLIGHAPGTRLIDVAAFARHLVVALRRDGQTGLRVLPLDGAPAYDIAFPEPIYSVSADSNAEFDTNVFRLQYTSMVTPKSVYDCDLDTGELTLRKRQPVLGGYDPDQYEQHREWAVTDDGTRIPVSLVCRRGTRSDGTAPLVLYGYGSYETSMDPWFSIPRLSLIDRGVVFAIAHVRGGGELGRHWYDNGKMLTKKNTFTDFVACARHLVKAGWSRPERMIARGGSAGGLLMGAVANIAPDSFRGIVAEVPFVDALNTILDPSLPLTVTEWEEWGDPLGDPEVYAYMKSYTPYENVTEQTYPSILAMTGLNDVRVSYHEPAKWVARLRATSPTSKVLLKTEMGAGHGGPSGRYDAWREESFVIAWILDQFGLAS